MTTRIEFEKSIDLPWDVDQSKVEEYFNSLLDEAGIVSPLEGSSFSFSFVRGKGDRSNSLGPHELPSRVHIKVWWAR